MDEQSEEVKAVAQARASIVKTFFKLAELASQGDVKQEDAKRLARGGLDGTDALAESLQALISKQ